MEMSSEESSGESGGERGGEKDVIGREGEVKEDRGGGGGEEGGGGVDGGGELEEEEEGNGMGKVGRECGQYIYLSNTHILSYLIY